MPRPVTPPPDKPSNSLCGVRSGHAVMTSPGLTSYNDLPSVLRRACYASGPTLLFARALTRHSVPSVAVRCLVVSPRSCPAPTRWRGGRSVEPAPVPGRPPADFPPETSTTPISSDTLADRSVNIGPRNFWSPSLPSGFHMDPGRIDNVPALYSQTPAYRRPLAVTQTLHNFGSC